jgi:adenosylhomocysteine nucleosidase
LVAAASKGIEQLNQGKEQHIKAVLGLITTGDTFMTKEEDVAKARANFPTMAAVEMEGAAIAQACLQLNTPFVVIRSLSDIAGKESPHTFEEYLQTAAVNSSQLVLNMLEQLQGKSPASLNS